MPRTNKTSEAKVQALFDRIASTYDSTNNAISLGMHKHWRKKNDGTNPSIRWRSSP